MNTFSNTVAKTFKVGNLNPLWLSRLLPTALSILLIIACTYTLSQITWILIPGDDKSASSSTQTRSQRAKTLSTPDFSHISQAHLFGQYQQTDNKPATTDAPETRLNLVLKGVLAATPMKSAIAIISQGKNGKEDNYSPGDKVASATIKEIHADRVILERNGRLETLRMPKDSSDSLIKSSPRNRARTSNRSSPGQVLANIRKQILKNPTSFGQYAIPVPYNENGKLRGYRLQPQGDRSLFDTVGLDPQDVIVAVNGVKLNNPTSGLKALRSLQTAKQIDITVLRNGAELPLQFEIP